MSPRAIESIEGEQVLHATDLDEAPQCVGSENMQWTTGDDVPLCHLAQNCQPFGIYKPDVGAVDVDVFIRSECVERGTQQWGSGCVNFATHHHNRHAVDMKPVNLQTTIDHCHYCLRLVRPPTVKARALPVNESIGP